MSLNEAIVEDAALTWFGELGYAVGHGPQLAPDEPAAERDGFGDVVLVGRLRAAIARLNPGKNLLPKKGVTDGAAWERGSEPRSGASERLVTSFATRNSATAHAVLTSRGGAQIFTAIRHEQFAIFARIFGSDHHAGVAAEHGGRVAP